MIGVFLSHFLLHKEKLITFIYWDWMCESGAFQSAIQVSSTKGPIKNFKSFSKWENSLCELDVCDVEVHLRCFAILVQPIYKNMCLRSDFHWKYSTCDAPNMFTRVCCALLITYWDAVIIVLIKYFVVFNHAYSPLYFI